MTNAAKDKGSAAEREVVHLINDLLGLDVRRTLAGHAQDLGDLSGLASTTVQIKSYADPLRAIREGLPELEAQQARAGNPFGVLFARRRGGRYIAVMTPEMWAAMWREATKP